MASSSLAPPSGKCLLIGERADCCAVRRDECTLELSSRLHDHNALPRSCQAVNSTYEVIALLLLFRVFLCFCFFFVFFFFDAAVQIIGPPSRDMQQWIGPFLSKILFFVLNLRIFSRNFFTCMSRFSNSSPPQNIRMLYTRKRSRIFGPLLHFQSLFFFSYFPCFSCFSWEKKKENLRGGKLFDKDGPKRTNPPCRQQSRFQRGRMPYENWLFFFFF